MNFSLMYPDAERRSVVRLTDESINDLSIDFIAEALTDVVSERVQLRSMMTNITGDERTIRYRCEIFDDFLRFPELRTAMSELVRKLSDLRDLEQYRMDSDASALWSLMNRMREISDYIDCITVIRDTLAGLALNSTGMLALRDMVTNIPEDSGFDALKEDIDDLMRKAQRLQSVTIGYTLPEKLTEKIHLRRARLYVTGTNLFCLTKYSGYDPEVDTRRATPLTPGVDYSAYPKSIGFVAGINVTF